MSRARRSNLGVYTGANVKYHAYIESYPNGPIEAKAPFLARASSLSNNDNFPRIPVQEIGNDGTNEFADGQHTGSLQVGKFWGKNKVIKRFLPRRDKTNNITHLCKKTFCLVKYSTCTGTYLEKFTGCKISRVSQSVSANGVFQGQLTIVYSFHDDNADTIDDPEGYIDEVPNFDNE